ncbi:hypothetical protein [Mycolicibacterium hippocampi]|nr:hypothetical protein [Mycolicibacterium hippocampi]
MAGSQETKGSEATAIEHVLGRLRTSYPMLSPDLVNEAVREAYSRFDGRPVRDFVPFFVERGARRRLADLTLSGREVAPVTPDVDSTVRQP